MGGGRERTRMMRMRMMIDRLIGLEKVRWSCYFHCVRACVRAWVGVCFFLLIRCILIDWLANWLAWFPLTSLVHGVLALGEHFGMHLL